MLKTVSLLTDSPASLSLMAFTFDLLFYLS